MARAMTETTEHQAEDDAQSLGQYLRDTRLELQLSLEEICRDTRIPERYLSALEADDYNDMPGAAYAGGFVRGYARHLGLDEEDILGRYRSEVRLEEPQYNFSLQEPPAESRLPTRGMMIGGLVVAVAAYGTWFSIHSKPMDVAENSIAAEPALVQISEPEEHRDALESFAPGAEGVDDAAQIGAEQAEAGLVETAAADLDDPVQPIEETVTEASSAPLEAASVETMVVEAIEDSWIHVTQGSDVLYSGVMKAGNRFTTESQDGVELTTGNAGGVLLRLGDWNSGPLGPSGRVRRGVSLNPGDWDMAQRAGDHS